MKSWFSQGSSGRRVHVTLRPATTFLNTKEALVNTTKINFLVITYQPSHQLACPVAADTRTPTTRSPSVYIHRHTDEGRCDGIHQRTLSLHGPQSGLGARRLARLTPPEWMKPPRLPGIPTPPGQKKVVVVERWPLWGGGGVSNVTPVFIDFLERG